ncbi:hypothetical protein IWQ62_004853 [Dispira parvispora]|uniref:Uncharacterized protein n=1 Tax=Dispira parvispora TaxID=1520584 RepID=A0A9W8AJZ5_9FUNG|nr:hypothetical protein IWQ62_004853 [Dispira parvispora]
MAHLPRRCKSGSQWTLEDLEAFNIHISPSGNVPSFSSSEPINPFAFRATLELMKNFKGSVVDYVSQVSQMSTTGNDGMARHLAQDCAVRLFHLGGYISHGRSIGEDGNLMITMCGVRTEVDIDVYIKDRNGLFTVLQANEIGPGGSHPEARVIAGAIAAYQYNKERAQELGIVLPDPYVLSCIVMMGISIKYLQVPVHTWLDDAIRNGTYPERETII